MSYQHLEKCWHFLMAIITGVYDCTALFMLSTHLCVVYLSSPFYLPGEELGVFSEKDKKKKRE